MQDKFIKARVPHAEYEALLARAGEAGQRLGTFVREVLERDAQAVSTANALARIEAALAATTTASAPARDHELRRDVLELRLLVRELAIARRGVRARGQGREGSRGADRRACPGLAGQVPR